VPGLSAAQVRKAALKLPRYHDRTDQQRADARHALAEAMRQKAMAFDDEQSYPFVDCPKVRCSAC
jgi:hypothetical protein